VIEAVGTLPDNDDEEKAQSGEENSVFEVELGEEEKDKKIPDDAQYQSSGVYIPSRRFEEGMRLSCRR
jgi:hypothetical protein